MAAGRKAAAPVLTARVGYLPSAVRCSGGPVLREKYHAIADQPVQVRGLSRYMVAAGEPLCSAVGLVRDPDPGLFAPVLSCSSCASIAAAAGVAVADGLAATPAG